jgi:tripartite-type tricarboxylate transporter receptor subunit TctC
MASTGVGSLPHLALEVFQQATGIKVVHVPYRGAAPA